jgi:hypothetical protein
MLTIEDAVLTYVTAFNTNDADEHRHLITQCFAEDGTIISNFECLVGYDAILDMLARFRAARPADRAVLTSGIEQHHNLFRFTAIVITPEGDRYSEALDIGEVGPDGRITRIITFHGPLPPPDPAWPSHLAAPQEETRQ